MRLVLVPGEVHIRATKPHGVKAKIQHVWDAVQRFPKDRPGIPTMPSLPGFQMLATCRLLYGQNHGIFYSSNTFFLPPGPFEETLTHFFRNLQAEHVNMISRLGVTFGYLLSDQVARAWGVAVQVHLSDIWQQKLAFLRRTREIKTVKLATVDRVLEIDGSNLGRAFRGIGACVCDYNICAKEVAELVAHAEMRVKKKVADRVERDGWRALRTWVIGGGCQSGL
ncbi:MAG: hypothetical protein ASARMPRED_004527 [Alectoria sarmentosa]|nr:MAG: hypothetical protein ASARMPRED_004527 [Alectoria sarmentosa]